ncbi:hypothetical protein MMAD_10410 [Mycolicibacterium madagascariense]|uniref:DUF2206 domain-containing protein n=1 Tax=Mycolicibacterium madagascariense TaxID=212765 RepID=A0A7I7XAR6_9MYCO|nr:DUF2206 domain-containing protein [Mycolicibacterium madagascariense]MCV7011366.1 DUF2206 domain-containing protein [Mycolicibacterium madagascariense]BBZ26746.1 hypothetical protein MMAD_10410 [Mycolicibacterium madagascariense]
MTATATSHSESLTDRLPQLRGDGDLGFALVTIVCAAVTILGTGPLLLRIVAGVIVAVCVPVLLLTAKIDWPDTTTLHEAVLYSLGLVVMGLMLLGLASTAVLPLMGVSRPLDRLPVAITMAAVVAGLALWRRRRWRLFDGLSLQSRSVMYVQFGTRDRLMLITAALLVVASVAGAIRLNNHAGGGVTTAMILVAVVVIVCLFAWLRTLSGVTVGVTIYLVSLALLFMTSLRGWFVSGHDIQLEMRMFDMALREGTWDIGLFRAPYNACLSITILPTMLERLTGIPGAYVFKVLAQLLYAVCPVLIYLIARRFSSKPVAVLGVVFFIAFPTYFVDMPFEIREEVALFLMGVALLLITDGRLTIRLRRIGFAVFGTGVMLSHYSTMYILLSVLILTWVLMCGRRVFAMAARRVKRVGKPIKPTVAVVNWSVLFVLVVLTFLWVGVVTRTSSEVGKTYDLVSASLAGQDKNAIKPDTLYSLFGGAKDEPQPVLDRYDAELRKESANGRASGENYPLSEVNRYPLKAVPAELAPLTDWGRAVERRGFDIAAVNEDFRSWSADILQIFIGVGVFVVVLRRARGFSPSVEFIAGAVAGVSLVGIQVLVPYAAAQYGVYRTLEQCLFWLAPFMAVGAVTTFAWLGRRGSQAVALGVALAFFLLVTRIIWQPFGGYPPALHLSNSGAYYDTQYLDMQEMSAMAWLRGQLNHGSSREVQAEASTARYALGIENYWDANDEILPTWVRQNTYVFLGSTALQTGKAAFTYLGKRVEYEYPVGFLDENKSLIYSSNGARVYR